MGTPFSNISEAQWWIERNCLKCWKGKNYIYSDKQVNHHCKVCEEIAIGFVTGEASDRTCKITRESDCPNRQEQRPEHKRKTDKYKHEPKLF